MGLVWVTRRIEEPTSKGSGLKEFWGSGLRGSRV